MFKQLIFKTLPVLLFFFSLVVTEPAWNLNQKSFSSPNSGYKITRNTLNHLQREGFSKTLTGLLSPILNNVYLNRKKFIADLPIHLTKKEQDLLLRFASTEQIKIQADEFSSDLNENAAVFRGNVKGVIPRENIELATAKLRLVSGNGSNFEKLIGEGGVQIKQWDREVRSDFAIYTQIDLEKPVPDKISAETIRTPQQTLQLKGKVLMKAAQGMVNSETVFVDLLQQQAVLEGQDASSDGRIRVEANLTELETNQDQQDKANKTAPAEDGSKNPTQPSKVILFASRAVLDNTKHQAMFEGNVEMERNPDKLYINAGKITLRLNDLQELLSIKAEQGVCFEQPGRVAKAEQANFNEIEQTILLEGNAEVQSGQYHLQGNSINLYLDVNKGVAQGDNKAPIQMTILGKQSPSIFACR
ncbi:MAG: hypothetical protein H8E38_06205 [SAR324 cluster bacterium]|nr:hypothetical protein [SAR324 cluster bacterium]MBL7034971.1 hypothetical protein [SAR324 cluster bacterium]